MKKFVSVLLLAVSLQASLTTESQAGLILAGSANGGAVDSIGSAALVTGLVSMAVGYGIGCDRTETTYRREPVYGYDRFGRRVRIGWRRVESSRCVVWNGNPTASTLMWTGLGLVVLDTEVSQDRDALDSTLREALPFVDSVDAIHALSNIAREKAMAVFAKGSDTALVSLTESEVRGALSEIALTDTEMQSAIDALK